MKRIFHDLSLVDIESGDIVTGRSLVVEQGRVVDLCVHPGSGDSVSLAGGFVLPGLIDSHVHLIWEGQPDPNRFTLSETAPMTAYRAARSARRSLCHGVTTVRDVGATDDIAIALARAVARGIVAGPRIVAAGKPIAQTGGHVYTMSREADGPDEVRKAVREQVKAGASLIKLMCSGGAYTEGESIHSTQLTREEIRVAVQEAKSSGKRVAAHALPERAIQNCLECGVDTVEHAAMLSEDNIAAFLDSGAFMVPTLAPYQMMATRGTLNGVPGFAVAKAVQVMERYLSSLQEAVKQGIRIALGTDAGSPQILHPTLPYEAWLWHRRAGVEIVDVLRAATLGSARAIGRDHELGLLRPGFYADFVMYDRNPLEEISVLHFPRAVFKAGEQVAAESVLWSKPLIEEGGGV